MGLLGVGTVDELKKRGPGLIKRRAGQCQGLFRQRGQGQGLRRGYYLIEWRMWV